MNNEHKTHTNTNTEDEKMDTDRDNNVDEAKTDEVYFRRSDLEAFRKKHGGPKVTVQHVGATVTMESDSWGSPFSYMVTCFQAFLALGFAEEALNDAVLELAEVIKDEREED